MHTISITTTVSIPLVRSAPAAAGAPERPALSRREIRRIVRDLIG